MVLISKGRLRFVAPLSPVLRGEGSGVRGFGLPQNGPPPPRPVRSVVPAVGRAREREQQPAPFRAGGELEHGGVVAVQHPHVRIGGVAKQLALVGVIGLDRGIAVQVVGGEVGEDADVGREVGAVVQLEGRDLDREPRIAVAPHGDVGERAADVPRRLGGEPRGAQQMGHQRGRSGLAVRSGDGDRARPRGGERAEAEIDFGQDGDAGSPGGHQWGRLGRDPGRHDHRGGRADARQVVPPDVEGHAGQRAQVGERVATVGVVGGVARVHPHAGARQQLRRRHPALPQAHHRDDAVPPRLRNHRTFSVARAIAAHMTPRM